MTVNVLIPKSGMGIAEMTLVRWLKSPGSEITAGEVIAELESAKALEELLAPASGILSAVLLEEGQTAPVHAVIATIEER